MEDVGSMPGCREYWCFQTLVMYETVNGNVPRANIARHCLFVLMSRRVDRNVEACNADLQVTAG